MLGFNEVPKVSCLDADGMSRRYFDHMIEELELANLSRHPKWFSTTNPVCYTLPDLQRDFLIARASRSEFYPTDYYRQLYWMPQNFIFPSYEPICFLRRNDKRNFSNKFHQYPREKRNYGEKKSHSRHERDDGAFRIERRFQSNWDHGAIAQHSRMPGEDRNPSRQSFRNSNIDLCEEDMIVDQHMKHFKQGFNSRDSSSEYLALRENAKPDVREKGAYTDSFRSVHYSDPSPVDWKEKGSNSNTHLSENSSYKIPTDFNNSYESWYCPEEQQQIVDMLKDVNLRHDRQLQRDILSSRGEPLCSDESASSNNDPNRFEPLQSSMSSDDEEGGIKILLSPRCTSPIQDPRNYEELKTDYLEKSASDFFEEFQNIFTGSPEKQIFNNLTKEILKTPSNLFIDCVDSLEFLEKSITDEDKDAVKTVLNFENMDDLHENPLESLTNGTFSSPKEISSEVLSEKNSAFKHEKAAATSNKFVDAKTADKEPKHSNENTIPDSETSTRSTNTTCVTEDNNCLTNFTELNKCKELNHKYNTLSKVKSKNNLQHNQNSPENILNKVNRKFKDNLECKKFKDEEKYEFNVMKNKDAIDLEKYSPARKNHIKRCNSEVISKSNNKFQHDHRLPNHFNTDVQKQCCVENEMKPFTLERVHEKSRIIYQHNNSATKAKNINVNSKDCCKTYNEFTVLDKHDQMNKNTPSKERPTSEPSLPRENEKIVYKRISVSEIFRTSNVKSVRDMNMLQNSQSRVSQFLNQFGHQTQLSPSAHLKLILGIGNNPADLHERNSSEINSSAKTSDAFKASTTPSFHFPKASKMETNISYSHVIETPISQRYPCCKIKEESEIIENERLKKNEECSPRTSNNKNLDLREHLRTSSKNEVNDKIEKSSKSVKNYTEKSECKTISEKKEFLKRKHCVTNSEVSIPDISKVISRKQHDQKQDGNKKVNHETNKDESIIRISKQKPNSVKKNAVLHEKCKKSLNSYIIEDEKVKNIKENCHASMDMNSSLVVSEIMTSDLNSNDKSLSQSPKAKKKYKKKKKEKNCNKHNLEKCVESHNSDGKNSLIENDNKRQIPDSSSDNKFKATQNKKKDSLNANVPNKPITDQSENNFAKMVNNKSRIMQINKNAKQFSRNRSEEALPDSKQINIAEPILEASVVTNNARAKVTNNSNKFYNKEKRYFKSLKGFVTKDNNSSGKCEFNETDVELPEKVSFCKGKSHNFKPYGILNKEMQHSSIDIPYKAPKRAEFSSEKNLPKQAHKQNIIAANRCIDKTCDIVSYHNAKQKNLQTFEKHKYNQEHLGLPTKLEASTEIATINGKMQNTKTNSHYEVADKYQCKEESGNDNAIKCKGNDCTNNVMQMKLLNPVPTVNITSFKEKLSKDDQFPTVENDTFYNNASSEIQSKLYDKYHKEKTVTKACQEESFIQLSRAEAKSGLKYLKHRNFGIPFCNIKVQRKIHTICSFNDDALESAILYVLEKFSGCREKYKLQLHSYCPTNIRSQNSKNQKKGFDSSLLIPQPLNIKHVSKQLGSNRKQILIVFVTPNDFHNYSKDRQVFFLPSKLNLLPILKVQIPLHDVISQIGPVDFKESLKLSLNTLLTQNQFMVLPILFRSLSILSDLQMPWRKEYLKEVSDLIICEHDNCVHGKKNGLQTTVKELKEFSVCDVIKCWDILCYFMDKKFRV